MKNHVLLLTSVLVAPLAHAQSATPGAITPQTGAPQTGEGGAPSLNFVAPGAPLESLSYEQARRMFRVQGLITPAEARANVAALAGTIVEMQGDVSGGMTTPKGRVFLIKIDGTMATFMVAPKFQNTAVLRSGSKARFLVEVGDDAGFTIVAATGQLLSENAAAPGVEPVSVTTLPAGTPPAPISSAPPPIITPENNPAFRAEVPKDDVVIVPPMSVMTAPAGGRVATGRFNTPAETRSGSALSSRGNSPEGGPASRLETRPETATTTAPNSNTKLQAFVDNQKASYVALIRRHNGRLTPQQADEIATALLSAGFQHNLDPRFLAAVVSVESSFKIESTSRSGAQGLGQIMPFNSRSMGINDPYNPTQNIFGMAKILRGHLDTFSRFGARGPLLAVAAYNAGPNAVKRAGYNVPAGAQVQNYVWKVYYRYKEFAPDMFK